ncbi:MAG: hypothetical protein KDJ97_27650 [Anaerolineae bacterium]|nr:hypothetical protein [Anaerolineae bacterium]
MRVISVSIRYQGMLSLQNNRLPFPCPRPGVVRVAHHYWSFDPQQPRFVAVIERRWAGMRLRYKVWQN